MIQIQNPFKVVLPKTTIALQEVMNGLRKHQLMYEIQRDGSLLVTLPDGYGWAEDKNWPDILDTAGEPVGFYDPEDFDLYFY